jgi:hypothetical protein
MSAVLLRILSDGWLRPSLRTSLRAPLRLALRLPRRLFLRPVVRAGLRPRLRLRNARLWDWRLRVVRPRCGDADAVADLRFGPFGPAPFVQQQAGPASVDRSRRRAPIRAARADQTAASSSRRIGQIPASTAAGRTRRGRFDRPVPGLGRSGGRCGQAVFPADRVGRISHPGGTCRCLASFDSQRGQPETGEPRFRGAAHRGPH